MCVCAFVLKSAGVFDSASFDPPQAVLGLLPSVPSNMSSSSGEVL